MKLSKVEAVSRKMTGIYLTELNALVQNLADQSHSGFFGLLVEVGRRSPKHTGRDTLRTVTELSI